MMDCFSKIVNGFWPLTASSKRCIVDVWQGPKHSTDTGSGWLRILKLYVNQYFEKFLEREKLVVSMIFENLLFYYFLLTILTGKDWCFTQFSKGMVGWLLLIFLICLHNKLSSIHSIISTDVWKMWFIKWTVKMDVCSFQQVLRQNLG